MRRRWRTRPSRSWRRRHGPPAPAPRAADDGRVERLEAELGALRDEVAVLRTQLEELRSELGMCLPHEADHLGVADAAALGVPDEHPVLPAAHVHRRPAAAADGVHVVAPGARVDRVAAGAGDDAIVARAAVLVVVARGAVDPVAAGAAAEPVAPGPDIE